MTPTIRTIAEKKLIGKSMVMSLAANRTGELWRSFMQQRKEIRNVIGEDLYSLQVYDPSYFADFEPGAEFIKWAAMAVSDAEEVPAGMAVFILPGGMYAVFTYRGPASGGAQVFQYIYGTWLPSSGYTLDNRPHFEILGEKYKNDSPDSEEEIWIPITRKTEQ